MTVLDYARDIDPTASAQRLDEIARILNLYAADNVVRLRVDVEAEKYTACRCVNDFYHSHVFPCFNAAVQRLLKNT